MSTCGTLPYERLDAYRRAHELTLAVYRLTRQFPADERFGLTMQLRRAASSVAINIAEGSAKRGPREFRRFLDVSIGSLSEVACLLRLTRDLGYADGEDWQAVEGLRNETGRLVWGLYRSMK